MRYNDCGLACLVCELLMSSSLCDTFACRLPAHRRLYRILGNVICRNSGGHHKERRHHVPSGAYRVEVSLLRTALVSLGDRLTDVSLGLDGQEPSKVRFEAAQAVCLLDSDDTNGD